MYFATHMKNVNNVNISVNILLGFIHPLEKSTYTLIQPVLDPDYTSGIKIQQKMKIMYVYIVNIYVYNMFTFSIKTKALMFSVTSANIHISRESSLITVPLTNFLWKSVHVCDFTHVNICVNIVNINLDE